VNWPPSTAKDHRTSSVAGTATENHQVECAGELGTSGSERRQTVEHLASFADSAGWLVVGVDQNEKTQAVLPDPVPLDEQPERVDHVPPAS
jgi:hypothetical protein